MLTAGQALLTQKDLSVPEAMFETLHKMRSISLINLISREYFYIILAIRLSCRVSSTRRSMKKCFSFQRMQNLITMVHTPQGKGGGCWSGFKLCLSPSISPQCLYFQDVQPICSSCRYHFQLHGWH